MSPSTIPNLSSLLGNDFTFKFVGEGAANMVFEIVQPQASHALLKGKLLRVPKSLTVALNYPDIQHYWETEVKPLFAPGDLVDQSLVKIGANQDIVSRMNAAVTGIESKRRKDFQGSFVDDAEYGMLVDDMRKKSPTDIVLEFKPKWFAQSPDAPSTAIRCRNCAKEFLRHCDKHPSSPSPQEPPLCSIDLLSSTTNTPARSRVLSIITTNRPDLSPSTEAYTHLNTWLASNTLLPRLSAAQKSNAGDGCLGVDVDSPHPGLDLTMTLRDCTCFIRIPGDGGSIEAKLADLDKKNGPAKLKTWQALEWRLVGEGWYTKGRPSEEWTCLLERDGGEGL